MRIARKRNQITMEVQQKVVKKLRPEESIHYTGLCQLMAGIRKAVEPELQRQRLIEEDMFQIKCVG